ncbi:hypothetical protein K474DRAFT_1268938 [Panus rudis PR-1116 ss-1]|nr:hypothetical protein K474DRAFT_1268938 [Panus rudis PR-1116 ss-1]
MWSRTQPFSRTPPPRRTSGAFCLRTPTLSRAFHSIRSSSLKLIPQIHKLKLNWLRKGQMHERRVKNCATTVHHILVPPKYTSNFNSSQSY